MAIIELGPIVETPPRQKTEHELLMESAGTIGAMAMGLLEEGTGFQVPAGVLRAGVIMRSEMPVDHLGIHLLPAADEEPGRVSLVATTRRGTQTPEHVFTLTLPRSVNDIGFDRNTLKLFTVRGPAFHNPSHFDGALVHRSYFASKDAEYYQQGMHFGKGLLAALLGTDPLVIDQLS